MNYFEKTYQIDPQRESPQKRERHVSIEKSDLDYYCKQECEVVKEIAKEFGENKDEKNKGKTSKKKSKKIPT